MSEIEGVVEVFPVAQFQICTQRKRRNSFSEDWKEGEPDDNIERSPSKKGELSPRMDYENEEQLALETVEFPSPVDAQAKDGSSRFQFLSVNLSDLDIQPGSPEHYAALGSPNIFKVDGKKALVPPKEERYSKSLPHLGLNSYPELNEELFHRSPAKDCSIPQSLSADSEVIQLPRMFPDIQLSFVSKSRQEQPVNSESLIDLDWDLFKGRKSKLECKRWSLPALAMDKASTRNMPERKRRSVSSAGSTMSMFDLNLPIEQQLRRMRKLRQKRKKQRRSQSIDISKKISNAMSSFDFRGMNSRRPSFSLPSQKKYTEPKQTSLPMSFCSFVKSEDINSKLEDFHSSIKQREPRILRAMSTRVSSNPWGNLNNASHKRHKRASSMTFIPKEFGCSNTTLKNDWRDGKSSAGVNGYHCAKGRTPRRRVSSLNRKKFQPPLEFQTIGSPNPFKRDPGWSQEISRKRKLAIQLKFEQLPCWKVLDDKLRHSKTLLCSVCKVSWEFRDSIVTLPCMHVYHRKCIHDWLQNSENCPQCKRSILEDGLNIVF